jgi:Tfp pilus assembly protein PilW
MRLRKIHRDTRGVTLIEFVMMLAILGLVVGGIYAFVVNGAISASKTNDFLQSQSQIRSALDNIVDEARWGQAVTAATATSVTIQMPGSTQYCGGGTYSVTFAYDSTNKAITRNATAPCANPGTAVPLAYLVVGAGGATGLTFTFYDGGNTSFGSTPSAGQLAQIARIRAVVATTSGKVTRYLAGDAALRAH